MDPLFGIRSENNFFDHVSGMKECDLRELLNELDPWFFKHWLKVFTARGEPETCRIIEEVMESREMRINFSEV